MRRSGDIVIRTGCVPTGILLMIWSVAESITVTESSVGATTNKLAAKAEEAKAQTMSSKGRRALLIIRSLLKPPGVDLDGAACFR